MLDAVNQIDVDTSIPPKFDCMISNGYLLYWSEGTSLWI